ncbi:hypothetical protein BH10BDE1_BH10BDE1_00110 [soil metagenome]
MSPKQKSTGPDASPRNIPNSQSSSAQIAQMQKRLSAFLRRHFGDTQAANDSRGPVANDDVLEVLATDVVASYEDGTRHYHNLSHIHHCLEALDQIKARSANPNLTDHDAATIELALWYHDIIYQPFSKTNERDSAERLFRELSNYKTDLRFKLANEMILASANHLAAEPSTEAVALFLDLDMGILGQQPKDYQAYARNIRLEYAKVPALLFYRGRKKLLKNWISQPIYRTNYFKEHFEAQAKQNLKNELGGWRYLFLF